MLGQNHLQMMCAGPSEEAGTATPEVYGFCDGQGRFHSFEGPEGKRMVMAMKGLEEKILANVEKSLVGMRQDIQQQKAKSQAQSWMLKNIVAEQKDMRDRIEAMNTEAFESRLDLMDKIDEISREALESRSDLIARTEEICQEAFESRLDCLTSLDDLEQKIQAFLPASDFESEEAEIKQEDALEVLESHKAKIDDLMAKLEDKANVSNLLASLHNVVASPATAEDVAEKPNEAPIEAEKESEEEKQLSAFDLDMAGPSSSTSLKEPKSLDAWLKFPELGTGDISFGDKANFAGALSGGSIKMSAPSRSGFNKKSAFAAPTFNIHQRPRPVAHMTSSQSMPFLAPLF